jgi:hypothetical protein
VTEYEKHSLALLGCIASGIGLVVGRAAVEPGLSLSSETRDNLLAWQNSTNNAVESAYQAIARNRGASRGPASPPKRKR